MYAKQEQQMTWPNAWLPLIWLCLASPPLSQQGGAKGIAARIRLDFNLCGGLSFISLLSLTFTLLFSRHFYLQFFFRREEAIKIRAYITHARATAETEMASSRRKCSLLLCVFVCCICLYVVYAHNSI